jgi:ribonuclease H / adenosylcobalamin/alpha-ribazole phosphatase
MVPSVRENLGEFRFGDWEGRSFEELNQDSRWHQFNAARSAVRAPGGELMVEVQTRMRGEVESLRRKHAGEMVLLVSHADPLRSLIAHYLGIPLDLILRFDISPASISIVRFFGDSPSLLCLNRTQEIPI